MNGAPVAFWDALCPEHGGLSHAVLHEAGHAVMAVHLGITFADVSISRDPRDNKSDVGRLTGGGVRMASPEDVEELVKRDLVGSFQFLVAGALLLSTAPSGTVWMARTEPTSISGATTQGSSKARLTRP